MNMNDSNVCKYCSLKLTDCLDEGLPCASCHKSVHTRCMENGGTPGTLFGDLFFIFTCKECSSTGIEIFVRDKLSWLKVLVLVMYHLMNRSSGLGRKGYFHWRNHIASVIDKNWEHLFTKEVKRKKKWIGTIAGTLSHFSQFFFTSGTSVINEPAWWALTYPKLTPIVIANLYAAFCSERQKYRILKMSIADQDIFKGVLHKLVKNKDLLTTCHKEQPTASSELVKKAVVANKRKSLLPNIETTSKKLLKINKQAISMNNALGEELTSPLLKLTETDQRIKEVPNRILPIDGNGKAEPLKLLDPMCHYNTSLNNLSKQKHLVMKLRLMGGIRRQFILSPYSGIYLKPFIRRDAETFPIWLRLMTDIQLQANENNPRYELPPRAPIDYTYVQPEHIPAVNSLCNQFFWPGIDLTESLQYPDFSCVALYKKLIIGFAFLIPNVSNTENYISFIFTRPGWRNVGIGKFMLYHLIQTSLGKDITLHVSINSPALFLYQQFGFKVESVVLDFYEKYIHNETSESKHAFFCRLER